LTGALFTNAFEASLFRRAFRAPSRTSVLEETYANSDAHPHIWCAPSLGKLGFLPMRRERVDHYIAATSFLYGEAGGASTQDHEAT